MSFGMLHRQSLLGNFAVVSYGIFLLDNSRVWNKADKHSWSLAHVFWVTQIFCVSSIVFRIGKCFRPDVLDHVSFNRPPAHNLFNPLFTSSCMSPARADVSFHKFRRPPTQGGFRLSDRHLTTIRGINALCGITRAFLFVSAHTFWEAKLAEVVETDECVHDRQKTSCYILENTI